MPINAATDPKGAQSTSNEGGIMKDAAKNTGALGKIFGDPL